MVFHSSESGETALRPVLELETDGALKPSLYYRGGLLEDTYTEDSDTNRSDNLSSSPEIVVAADKTIDSSNGALYSRNGFIKLSLPTKGSSTHYDSAKVTFRGLSIANADQTISLVPISSDWSSDEINWESSPEISGEAAATTVLPYYYSKNSMIDAMPLVSFTFDVTDYVNNNPSEDGIYAFALTAATAVGKLCSSEYVRDEALSDEENAIYHPLVECIYRENASLTIRYVDENGNDISAPANLTLPEGTLYTPSDYPLTVDERIFSTDATNEINSFPYIIEQGSNEICLVYEDKIIESVEEISVTTVQYEAPELPEQVEVSFSNGSKEKFSVSWSDIEPESYASSGEFTVMGTLRGIAAEGISATVKVLGISEISIPLISTAPGSRPALPEMVTVQLDNGTEYKVAAVWDEIDAESYASVGSFVANGTVVLSGMRIQTTVLVEEGENDDRSAVADAYIHQNEPTTAHNTDVLEIGGVSASNASASALYRRGVFLRFKCGDFGSRYFDSERNDYIDEIVNSKVRLYVNEINNSATVTYKIYGLASDDEAQWDEASVTWNTAQDIISRAEYLSSMPVKQSTFTASWVELDVTEFVRNNCDAEYLSFYIDADLCMTKASSKEGENAPVLRTSGYIPDANVTLKYVAEIGGEETELLPSAALKGKLGYPYDYQSSIINPIYYPDADSEGIYYYNFVTKPDFDGESTELDPDLHLDELADSGNEIFARYTRREITSAEPVQAETYRGVKPELPETVTAYLDNGTPISEKVEWLWDEVDFRDYSVKGSFSLRGKIEHSDEVYAEAEIAVKQAVFAEAAYPVMNEFGIEPGESYRLSFVLQNGETLTDELAMPVIKTGGTELNACDLSPSELGSYIRKHGNGAVVEIFFTAPESDSALTLHLADCVNYMTEAELSAVQGRGCEMTLHYMIRG